MALLQLIAVSLGVFFLINHFVNKHNLLLDDKKSSLHKIFIDKKINPPFTGGVFILFSLFFLLPNTETNFKIFIFLIFISGFLSDIRILKSANLRFIIQIIIVLFAVSMTNQYVQSIKWDTFDILLINNYFKLLFTSFCILVIINGTNFIDGLNTLVIGYYLIIFICISIFYKNNDLFLVTHQTIIFFSAILLSLLILNSFNLLYLGDNGAYLLAFFTSIILIDLSVNLKTLSPYYVANLLWYPAYENLFSIIRKIKNKKSALMPDNSHLHQLIYLQIKNKFNMKSKTTNTVSGIAINIFNLGIFILATKNYAHSEYQIILLLFSLTIYNVAYVAIKKNLQK